jgi:hypothetical protein
MAENKMKDQEKKIKMLFRFYKENKKQLETDFNIPVPSAISYDKISVLSDKSKNTNETFTIDYIHKREELFKKVFIVEEVLNWFKLEGHGRERFVKTLLIDGCSWRRTCHECHISEGSVYLWEKEVFAKAEMVAKWVNYF